MKSGLRFLVPLFCLAGLLTAGTAAHADTFDFEISISNLGSGATGGGTLTAVADPNIAGAFDVTSLFGYLGSYTLTFLPYATYDPSHPCQTSPAGVYYDNVLYPDGAPPLGLQLLDYAGLGVGSGDGMEGTFYTENTHQLGFITTIPHDRGGSCHFFHRPRTEQLHSAGHRSARCGRYRTAPPQRLNCNQHNSADGLFLTILPEFRRLRDCRG